MTLLLVSAFCLVSAGCSGPVEEVKAFINAKDDLILQISKKLEANPTEAGVDEARKVFEAKKEDLIAKRVDAYKKVGGQHSDLIQMLLDSAANDRKILRCHQ
jgi:hypothetical protein